MKQLTGLDATFLYMETATMFGHVNGLGIYQRPSPTFDPYEAVYAKFASVIGDLEPFRRRLVEVPMRLDHPYWINDPDFDLDYHIRHMSLAPPGRVDQLAEQVSRIVGRPMDRAHPLWEVYVIEGLESGRWALLTKFHHATIDGASGVMMMSLLNDTDPHAPPPGPSRAWEPEPVPSDVTLLNLALRNLAMNPVKALRTQLRLMRGVAEGAGVTSVSGALERSRATLKTLATRGDDRPRLSVPNITAPPTPWNKAVTAHRRFAMRSASLANLKRLKDATGSTLNDIVMAVCAGALREYLLRHDALPDRPLRAMVPVSIRTGNETDPWTNRVSSIFVDLPTDSADPLERIQRCHDLMEDAKRRFQLVPADALVDLTQYSSPVLAASAMRLATQLRLANRVNFPVNVVISNVPGPRQPLYLAGARLDHYVPVSTISEGVGLNITVHSYLDKLDFGLIACRELVPDLWDMIDLHIDEIAVLFEATGAEWAEPPAPAQPRRGPAGQTAAVKRKKQAIAAAATQAQAEAEGA